MMAGLLLSSAAAAQAQPINEGFDNITTLPGAGWFLRNNSAPLGATGWFQGNSTVFPAQGGAPTAYIAANYQNTAGTGTISNWLLTPPISLANGATFSFYTRTVTTVGFPDRLQVRMSLAGNGTDVGTTATSVGTFTALLLDINPTYTLNGYPNVWTQFTVTISGVATPTLGRLAFRYFVENGGPTGANSDYIGIDTVVFTPVLVQPTRLTVDPTGNFVIEPGEAGVTVAPFWRNTSTSTIASLTGTASNLTGPAGPSYVITDNTANYGSLAAGAEGSCTATGNCYGVTISGTRPAQHWDATMDETVSAGPTSKTWELHVGGSFSDVVTTSPFYRFIETLFHHGVTGGCGTGIYCPTNSTTRDQMSVFVLVAKEGAGYTPPACVPPNLFSDVPETSPFCRFIEELANRNVVTGCGPNLYCPSSPVTRAQMAVFVLRTLDPTLNPPACTTPVFTDVPASDPFCRWIEELVRRGVVTGCGGGNYCPGDAVTREQMGVFISVTFGLTLYGP
ncbi:MAG TPA: choice-of-anchor J domain-containing protein [Vicinamibacteria bacterium]|nr:choice-of-anchor J domain-containing protein [Vicinamibacteria bacterium]